MPPAAVADLSCVVTSLPRSGSWLLADGLTRTGRAGRPEEYLRPELEARYTGLWGLRAVPTNGQLWEAMLRAGTTANGVFGLKVHWQDFARLLRLARTAGRVGTDREVFESIVPTPRYVHIVRRDTLRQALSWCRALDSNQWWAAGASAPAAERPWDPDFDEVELLLDLLTEQERAWRRFFAAHAICPLEVVYEDLARDYVPTIRRVLEHLGVDAAGAVIPPPALRRQADDMSGRWAAKYLHVQRATAPERRDGQAGTAPASVGSAPIAAGPYRSLEDVLAPHPWTVRSHPFPHVVARNVLRPEVYAEVDRAFEDVLARGMDAAPHGFGRSTPGYDVFSHTMRTGQDGPFALFLSRPWHDAVAVAASVAAGGHVFCGLHHHAVGSASGSVHNDLNPGFFPRAARPDEVVLNDHALCSYYSGESQAGVQPVETVRAVALIFFVHNQPWSPGDGGEIGLYASAAHPIERPAVAVPPINNSMVFFECTPHSFHGFISNRRIPRNSLIMWIHRPPADVIGRWGADPIVRWPSR
ncbi:MAG: sulfotransferase [Candidatus Dormibacteraeota bacterium]|uniref:Sulfotransferase n=1 Tax=Candidatus Amunia macphersoniae TaxID=3127014 RepID=A0A934NHL3_9BACT|nr:sulfotransferase [Candidatus Dormibacteraeota bacterium]